MRCAGVRTARTHTHKWTKSNEPTWLYFKFAYNLPADLSSTTHTSHNNRAFLLAAAKYNTVAFNRNIEIAFSRSALPPFLRFHTKRSWDGAPRDCGLLPDNVGLNSSFPRPLRGGVAVCCETGGTHEKFISVSYKNGVKQGFPNSGSWNFVGWS